MWKDEMGGAYSTHGGKGIHTGLRCEKLKKRGYVEDQGLHGRIMLKCVMKKLEKRFWSGFD
jgi:hypothetical protein